MIVFMGNIKRILGDNIRTLRTSKGWTQVYLSDCLEITAPFLAQIESGKRGMSLELIESVANLFEIPIAALFFEQENERLKNTDEIRVAKLHTLKKQLLEAVTEDISDTFARLQEIE